MPVSHVVAYSDDDGKTWTKPRDITDSLYAQLKPARSGADPTLPGPGGGIVLERGKYAGRLVAPMCFGAIPAPPRRAPSTATTGAPRGRSEASCTAWRNGWRRPVVWWSLCGVELCDGSLLFNGRTLNQRNAASRDVHPARGRGRAKRHNGDTGSQTSCPDPNCQGAVARHSWPKDGKPGTHPVLWPGPDLRRRVQGITCSASYDDGKTWTWKGDVLRGAHGLPRHCRAG